jgi:hypothetical protein
MNAIGAHGIVLAREAGRSQRDAPPADDRPEGAASMGSASAPGSGSSSAPGASHASRASPRAAT